LEMGDLESENTNVIIAKRMIANRIEEPIRAFCRFISIENSVRFSDIFL
jgi:hypothetical protein